MEEKGKNEMKTDDKKKRGVKDKTKTQTRPRSGELGGKGFFVKLHI